jgi:drug/metabolite transporter (DMT)-like permease
MTSNRNIGYLLAALAVSTWAFSSGFLVKFTQVDGLTFAAWGGLFGFGYGALLLAGQGQLGDLRPNRQVRGYLWAIAVSHAANAGLFFSALKIGLVGNATLSHYIAPILVTCLFAPLLLHERLTRMTLYLTVASFFGLALLFVPSLGAAVDWGLLLGAASGVAMALHVTLERKVSLLGANPLVVGAYKSIVVCVAFGYFALRGLPTTSPIDFAIMALWGVLVLGVSLQLFQTALGVIPATHAAIITYLEPVGALLIAALLLDEPITLYTVVGGLIILGSGLLLVVLGQRGAG